MKRIFILFNLAAFILLFESCAALESEKTAEGLHQHEKIKITCWNLQTFFDASNDGLEYDEFVKSKSWGKEMYTRRVSRLCSSIKKFDSDVLVFEEVENAAVLYDISNFMAGEWNFKKVYRYSCFAKSRGSSIGVAVLSRLPLENMSVHEGCLIDENSMPRLRPLLKVSVCLDGEKFDLFVNHWKSMSGGKEESEKWRNMQEGVLAREVAKSLDLGKTVVALGDFNRDINDFYFADKKVSLYEKFPGVMLRFCTNRKMDSSGVEVKSLWFDENSSLIGPGSYNFKNEWSRIDNIFVAGSVKVVSFFPETEGEWCGEEDFIPKKYSLWNGEGYSDHLPLSCVLKF